MVVTDQPAPELKQLHLGETDRNSVEYSTRNDSVTLTGADWLEYQILSHLFVVWYLHDKYLHDFR